MVSEARFHQPTPIDAQETPAVSASITKSLDRRTFVKDAAALALGGTIFALSRRKASATGSPGEPAPGRDAICWALVDEGDVPPFTQNEPNVFMKGLDTFRRYRRALNSANPQASRNEQVNEQVLVEWSC